MKFESYFFSGSSWLRSAVFLLNFLMLAISLQATHIDVDTSFGVSQTGIVSLPLGSFSQAFDVAIDANNNIVITGFTDSSIYVARFTSAGVLDTTFGGGAGYVITSIGTDAEGRGIAIQSDGKIVVCGYAVISGVTQFVTLRYESNGDLDTTTFGGGLGYVSTIIGAGAVAYRVRLQSNGYIIVGGDTYISSTAHIAIVRYDTSGVLDTSYGTSGIYSATYGAGLNFSDLAIQPANDFVVATGYTPSGGLTLFYLTRLDTTGTPDSSFGTSGVVTTQVNGATDSYSNAMSIQSTGKIVVGGFADAYNVIIRYNTNGSFDTTFGSSGIAFVDAGATLQGLTLGASDSVVIAGTQFNLLFVSRYTSAGVLDTTFGNSGNATLAIGSFAQAQAVTVQTDGKIVAVGDANSVNTLARFYADNSPSVTISTPANGATLSLYSSGLNGFTSETNTPVRVTINATVFTTVTSNSSGYWDAGTSWLYASGANSVTADVLNPGVIATATNNFTVSASDSIVMTSPVNSGIFNTNIIVVSGTSTRASASVEIRIDTVLVATVTTDNYGNWTFTTGSLLNGAHAIEATLVPASINVTNNITIVGPDFITVTNVTFGLLNSMTISGTSTRASAPVFIFIDGSFVTSVTSTSTGTWTTTFTLALVVGSHLFSADLLNGSGNVLASGEIIQSYP